VIRYQRCRAERIGAGLREPTKEDHMLQGETLKLTYQDGDTTVDAVHDVSMVITDHQFIGILGPSGSGKSSLLYLLSGLRRPTKGEIYLDDRAYGKMSDKERVALRRHEFGFVFQQHFLINYLTAQENVMVAAAVQDSVARLSRPGQPHRRYPQPGDPQ
jgi:putative ABC transport system ATP-binding protein